MSSLNKLSKYLRISIEKNGDKPLTLSHLANIIDLLERNETRRQEKNDRDLDEAYMQILADQCGDRD